MEDAVSARTANVKTASGINLVAGVWLIIAPFIIGYVALESALWNDILCGAIVLILAAIRVAMPLRHVWLSWVNLVVGLWLIIAPFVLDYAAFPAPVWNDILVGILIAGMAGWSGLAAGTPRPTLGR